MAASDGRTKGSVALDGDGERFGYGGKGDAYEQVVKRIGGWKSETAIGKLRLGCGCLNVEFH